MSKKEIAFRWLNNVGDFTANVIGECFYERYVLYMGKSYHIKVYYVNLKTKANECRISKKELDKFVGCLLIDEMTGLYICQAKTRKTLVEIWNGTYQQKFNNFIDFNKSTYFGLYGELNERKLRIDEIKGNR